MASKPRNKPAETTKPEVAPEVVVGSTETAAVVETALQDNSAQKVEGVDAGAETTKPEVAPEVVVGLEITVKNNSRYPLLEPKTRTRIKAGDQVVITCKDEKEKAAVLNNIQQVNSLAGYKSLQVIE